MIPAPPRELLKMFSGKDGLEIDEFRQCFKSGVRISVKDEIFIAKKQIIEAEQEELECETKLMQLANTQRDQQTTKRVMHKENPAGVSKTSTADIVRTKKTSKPIGGAKTLMGCLGSKITKQMCS